MKPSEHKTIRSRILKYGQEFGWTFISSTEVEERRECEVNGVGITERIAKFSL